MLSTTEAEAIVESDWGEVVRDDFGQTVRVDPTLTEEFDWGWIVCFPSSELNVSEPIGNEFKFVISRKSGGSMPVGSKGIKFAVRDIID